MSVKEQVADQHEQEKLVEDPQISFEDARKTCEYLGRLVYGQPVELPTLEQLQASWERQADLGTGVVWTKGGRLFDVTTGAVVEGTPDPTTTVAGLRYILIKPGRVE